MYQALGKNSDLAPVQLVEDGQAVVNPRSMANTFNKFFTGKVKKLRDGITGEVSLDPLVRLERWLGKSRELPVPDFTLQPITCQKLRKVISKMKGNHACGIDMIDGFSMKLACPLIEDVILHLVNLSLTRSQFPQYWKVSKISPYHKKGDKQLTENYRPVSNLNYISMICEGMV